MRRRVVPGAYVAGDSALHRLDPRVKLILLMVWTVGLFALDSWAAFLAVAAGLAGLLRVAKLPLGSLVRGLKPVGIVLAAVVLFNAARFDGTGAWQVVGVLGVAPDGLMQGLRAVARIALMVGLALLLPATTPVSALTEALLSLLAPLRKLHVPVDDVAMTLSIALRFIPVCGEQFERVVAAQRARGARMGEGSVVERVRSWIPVLIPLFVGLFRRSDALARAMEARCYRGTGRTSLSALRLRRVDVAVLVGGIVTCVVLGWLL